MQFLIGYMQVGRFWDLLMDFAATPTPEYIPIRSPAPRIRNLRCKGERTAIVSEEFGR